MSKTDPQVEKCFGQPQEEKGWQPTDVEVQTVARICHEANRALCITQGDLSQPDWDSAPDWQKESAIEGARHHLTEWRVEPNTSHDLWMRRKLMQGWRYGVVKDVDKKEHPCLLPRRFLPKEEQMKDDIFTAICQGYRQAMMRP